MFSLSRRDFLKGSALLAAAAAGCNFLPDEAEVSSDPPAQANPAPRGANERLNVAVLGCRERGRGMDHINGFLNRDLNCTITHLCDVDSSVPGPAQRRIEQAQGRRPA